MGWNHQPDKQNGCSTKSGSMTVHLTHRIPHKDLSCGQCHSGDIHWRVAISRYWMGTLVFQADAVIWRNLSIFPKKLSNKSYTPTLSQQFMKEFFAFECLKCQGYLGVLLDFHGRGMLLWVIFQAMRSYKFLFWAFGWPHFLSYNHQVEVCVHWIKPCDWWRVNKNNQPKNCPTFLSRVPPYYSKKNPLLRRGSHPNSSLYFVTWSMDLRDDPQGGISIFWNPVGGWVFTTAWGT